MNPSSSWKRSHIATGSTPNIPSEKRQRNGNFEARKPLDFSSENVENSEQTVNVICPFRGRPRHKVTVQVLLFLIQSQQLEMKNQCNLLLLLHFALFPCTTNLVVVMQKYYI